MSDNNTLLYFLECESWYLYLIENVFFKMLNQKKFVRRKVKNFKIKIQKFFQRILHFLRQKHRKWTYIIITVLLLIIISPIILSKTFFSEENKIAKVSFLADNIAKFDDPGLYKDIKQGILGKNIFVVKYLWTKSLLKEVQSKYNIVKDIKVISEKDKRNQVTAEIEFNDLSFLFNDWSRNIWVLDGKFYILMRDTTFLSGNSKIYLPSYVQNLESFTWFFYKIPENILKDQIQEIKNFFDPNTIEKIKYIPGATRTVLELKESNISTWEQRKLKRLTENDIWFGKKIFFNNSKDISKQLNLYLLTKQELEKWDIQNIKFDQIKEIDVWWLDYVIICVDTWWCLRR